MLKRLLFAVLLVLASQARAGVTTVDFLKEAGVTVNAAGPLLMRVDIERNRLIAANTLTSSISLIDCATSAVVNIPLGGRGLQHLKAEAMTVRPKTGEIYLIGAKSVHIVDPEKEKSRTIRTEAQFESIAVDDETGNVYVTGREYKSLGSIKAGSEKVRLIEWLDHREELINLNQTPPPPIRKVISAVGRGQIIAVDGFTSTLYLFDAEKGTNISSRALPLTGGGRWHLAGYSETDHCLYVVVETDKRTVIEAAKIDIAGGNDVVVPLPELTEGVGIIYNPVRDEIYIPYDNHPTVHVAGFEGGGSLDEIKIPAYGNDASAIDLKNDLLYVASWAFGEVDVIDLKSRRLVKRITGLGIIPHMFVIAFNPNNNRIYFPKGATAVNGTFGSAVSVLDPVSEKIEKIYTGWSPIDLIELKDRGGFLLFNSEDQMAVVSSDGSYETHTLPFDYPIAAAYSPQSDIYLSYGPHQSYWPTVYIWDAKNGILTIDTQSLRFYDRRIPRQAHEMALDRDGILYFTQNNWGKEEQFLGILIDEVRVYEAGQRLGLGDEVEREITQRILQYDEALHRLYLVRIGETDDEESVLQIIDPAQKSVIKELPVGVTATDLVFDDEKIYVANFDSRSVSVIDKSDFTVEEIKTDEMPLKLCRAADDVFVISHRGNTLQPVRENGKRYKIPFKGMPDNCFAWNGAVVITSHSPTECAIIEFDPKKKSFTTLHELDYPYGDTRFDSGNVSFYVRGQFGDAIFEITQGETDGAGRLWISDFLSGKLYIVTR